MIAGVADGVKERVGAVVDGLEEKIGSTIHTVSDQVGLPAHGYTREKFTFSYSNLGFSGVFSFFGPLFCLENGSTAYPVGGKHCSAAAHSCACNKKCHCSSPSQA